MSTVIVCADCDHEWPCKHTPESELWRYALPMTAPFISRHPYQTPADRMAPLIEWLARNPSAAIPALVEGLAQITGPAKAARILRLAADAAERLK